MMNKRTINNWLIGGIIIIVFVLAFLVIKPILRSIIFGLICAYIFGPVFKSINKKIKNKTFSALLLLLMIGFLVILPLFYFIPILIEQTFRIFDGIREINIAEVIIDFFPFIERGTTAHSLLLNLNNLPGKFVSNMIDYLFFAIVNSPKILLQMTVFVFTFFYALKDSDKLKEYLSSISPFSKQTQNKFLKEFRGVTNSIILGQVLIGIVQGLSLGIGLWLLDVPYVLTLTALTVVVSIIPVIGPWLVWIPVSIYLIFIGDASKGVILALYGGLFVSNVDNFLRPYLLSKTTQLPIAIGLIGTIGGLYFLGIIGLILGPLILAYALIIIDFYKDGRLDELYNEDKRGGVGNYEIKS